LPVISARFSDRLPCERNGTRTLLEPGDDVDGVTATTVASGQSRGPSSVVDTTVAAGSSSG
jgi:hypothetical protein